MRAPHRVLLLVGFAILLGSHAARVPERAKEIPTPPTSKAVVEAVATSAPAAAPAAPSSARETEPPPARETPPGFPRYEVLGSTASPDGRSWCILDVQIEQRLSKESLRSIWNALREEQRAEWCRFTCRFYLPDMAPPDAWVDVNELWILESPRAEALAASRDLPWRTLEEAWHEDGEVAYADMNSPPKDEWTSPWRRDWRCVIFLGERVIELPVSSDAVEVRGKGAGVEIRYLDLAANEWKTVRPFEDGDLSPRPICAGALMR